MNNNWVDFWNDRYAQPEYAYGEAPNEFLQQQLQALPPGAILLPAEGEGRNAVFAASQGWQVSAFDLSVEGQKKALQLAAQREVSIDYQVGNLADLPYQPEQFDAIALIYAHFQAEQKSQYHRLLDPYLKKGGLVIFEAFSKQHLHYVAQNPSVGGPRDEGMLFSVDEIRADFGHYDVLELVEQEVTLHEGRFHNGTGSVVRFVGRKR